MDCEVGMKELSGNSVDLLCTDPPYGYSFMGKDWDKAVPKVAIWRECLRLLKPGAFAFVMSAPRQDVLSRMIVNLQDAGFDTGFTSIFWAYSSGFPKAANIGKMVDKQLGCEREIIGNGFSGKILRSNGENERPYQEGKDRIEYHYTKATSEQAKALDGSYGGFQPKPAVEIIIVAMKPLSQKTFIGQALENQKGITWLDDCRIPTDSRPHIIGDYKDTINNSYSGRMDGSLRGGSKKIGDFNLGRFPANLLVSDDVLNDGNDSKIGLFKPRSNSRTAIQFNPNNGWHEHNMNPNDATAPDNYGDGGSFSRYFDLDKWWEERIKSLPESVQDTYPFLICPKASKGEKNIGCEELEDREVVTHGAVNPDVSGDSHNTTGQKPAIRKNIHPTVKPLKLMSYLVTLGSRPNDVILDPFIGSGTTARAFDTPHE